METRLKILEFENKGILKITVSKKTFVVPLFFKCTLLETCFNKMCLLNFFVTLMRFSRNKLKDNFDREIYRFKTICLLNAFVELLGIF